MARFKTGDRARGEMSTSADYVGIGTITAVIASQHALKIFDEYEVDFGTNGTLIAYDSQLQSV